MTTARIPQILELARARGHVVFTAARDANLVVLRGPGFPGDWDGLLHYAWNDGPRTGWTVLVWPCATRPGRPFLSDPPNAQGTAMYEPGQFRLSHRPGLHHGRRALVQVRPVTVRRYSQRDGDLFGEPGTLDSGLFGCNIHDVITPQVFAGCIGLLPPHMAELLAAHEDLGGGDVSLTVVTG